MRSGEFAYLVGLRCLLGSLHRWLACPVFLGSLPSWWASAALGVGAAKNLRKHARAALVCFTSFCGHAPFCNFFITHPLTRRLASLAGLLVNTGYGYRILQTRGVGFCSFVALWPYGLVALL